jgi:hypothetical protein
MTECRNAALRLLFMPSKLLAEISLGSTSISVFEILLSGKKRQNHIFSTNIISYTCFTKKGLSFEAM